MGWALLAIVIGIIGFVIFLGNYEVFNSGVSTANTAANITEYDGFLEVVNILPWLAPLFFVFLIGAAAWYAKHRS